ncbi:MAG: hypothetical protein AAFN41_11825, partial [Planctomycetota bacterium]
GLCIYQSNYGALKLGLRTRQEKVRARVITDNIHYLHQLTDRMEMFTVDRDFGKFIHHSELLSREFDLLRHRLRGAN